MQSSRHAFGGRLTFGVSLLKTCIIQAMKYPAAFHFPSGYSLGFGFLAGLRLGVLRQFKTFGSRIIGTQSRINFEAPIPPVETHTRKNPLTKE